MEGEQIGEEGSNGVVEEEKHMFVLLVVEEVDAQVLVV